MNEPQHPLIVELIKFLPPPGTTWPEERRELWLTAAKNVLALLYHSHPPEGSLDQPDPIDRWWSLPSKGEPARGER